MRFAYATRLVQWESVILGAMVGGESTGAGADEPSPAARKTEHKVRDLRQYIPRDLVDVSFPVSVRGYERGAVDAYIERVNRVIAELKVTGSPPAAVRRPEYPSCARRR